MSACVYVHVRACKRASVMAHMRMCLTDSHWENGCLGVCLRGRGRKERECVLMLCVFISGCARVCARERERERERESGLTPIMLFIFLALSWRGWKGVL